jgi:hemoglobin-like flavoprotein
MTRRQIQFIQTSLEQVLPIADTAAALFYGRLFEMDPHLRPLLVGDVKAQGRQLMHWLTAIVRTLETLDDLIPVGQALGRRWASLDLCEDDYAEVAEAMCWTLQKGLGEAFTAEVEEAWLAAYTLLIHMMKAAVRSTEAAQVTFAGMRRPILGGVVC